MKNLITILFIFSQILALGVPVITVDGAINPVSSKYITRNIRDAEHENAPCLVLQLDTPGGLLSSTEDLTRAFMASKIPIVVYVHPKGGRAASAGVFLVYSAHISAMTPGTRIGAAHPVDMMGGGKDSSNMMMEKVSNDAIANLRAIAIERGRNPDWVEKAIRKSESVTADEALELDIIEIIAENTDSLLAELDGFVYGPSRADTIRIPNPVPDYRPMLQLEKFLFTILNPNIAYLLLMLGMLGIFLELQNPGSVLPGVVGGVSILLAFYAFQILPINYAGFALIILAIILFIAETRVPSFGLLGIGGIVAMLAGSFLLTSGNPQFFRISWSVIFPTVVVAALFILVVAYKVAKIRLTKPASGMEGLIGEKGIIAEPKSDKIKDKLVNIHGEVWAVIGNELKPGDNVEVISVVGNKLVVKKI